MIVSTEPGLAPGPLFTYHAAMAERVRITEVGPRDGLQNEPGIILTEQKVRLVELCCATGVDEVEVTSFVSPKWVPQLGDAAEVFRALAPWLTMRWPRRDPVLSALVPNLAGLKALNAADADLIVLVQHAIEPSKRLEYEDAVMGNYFIRKFSVFTAASESFSKRNTNASIDETIERFHAVMAEGYRPSEVRGYISCAIACPFEGPSHPRVVARVARRLAETGVCEIDLGDTIGAADVASTVHLLEVVRDELGAEWFSGQRVTLHLHDTHGRAAECVKAALDLGIRSFDGSVAGLGGCPYASTPGRRAPGNISTETLVRTVHGAGYETGVDLDRLAVAADYARSIVAASRGGPAA